jgi:hypothetical protein
MGSTGWHIYQQFIVIEHEKHRRILDLWFYSLITSPKDPQKKFPNFFNGAKVAFMHKTI